MKRGQDKKLFSRLINSGINVSEHNKKRLFRDNGDRRVRRDTSDGHSNKDGAV